MMVELNDENSSSYKKISIGSNEILSASWIILKIPETHCELLTEIVKIPNVLVVTNFSLI